MNDEGLVQPLGDWEPDVMDYVRNTMVKGQEYAVAASVNVGSIQYQVTGQYQGLVNRRGDKFVHIESLVFHHYVDVDFIREIRPLTRVEVW